MIFLMTIEEFWCFLKRYFPVHMAALFAQGFAVAIGVPMMFDGYFRGLPLGENLKYSFFSVLGLAFLIAHCNFMIMRGCPSWLWIPVVLMVLSLLGVLPTIEHRPHKVFYVLGLLFPLLALLLINSKRHREARAEWVKLRQQRLRIAKIIRTQRQRVRRRAGL
ncbi:hypothetical protein [Pseudomonas marginalis]|uniref:Uncharacterized protein n=2 Tax=Pseudomonas marginalis TaxID=298 RepID=A0A3M3WEC9_PSEMA|nr:hypothetical protein [Pseudomonas marginalis]OAJ47234.1 hypothetical protein AO064_08135 [Pseudomonas marginalis]RMO56142.1 hypothetical protein ALQ38_02643 [Pseudomonas marginalis pv. marginalis]RMP02443.1 hypothetical protein ALQ29_04891 [Pseudomonas marginalis pv. marginalis]